MLGGTECELFRSGCLAYNIDDFNTYTVIAGGGAA